MLWAVNKDCFTFQAVQTSTPARLCSAEGGTHMTRASRADEQVLCLQELTSGYLEQLSSGTTLTLSATRPGSRGLTEIERINKVCTGTSAAACLLFC